MQFGITLEHGRHLPFSSGIKLLSQPMQWDAEEHDLHFGIAMLHAMHLLFSLRTVPFAQVAQCDQE